MNSSARAAPPRLKEGIDVRSLPIEPRDAFVMSRIDGQSSDSQIAAATGLDLESVIESLRKLHQLGAIHYAGAEANERSGEHPRAPAPASPSFVLFDPRELDEEAELPRERKQRILETYYALDDLTHYELLQVSSSADKKSIKAAYYQVVNVFHPDRYFGKSLGSFKSKLDRVFARMTEAHEILTRNATRDEYDAYLATKRRTSRLDNVLDNPAAVAAAVERANAEIEQQAMIPSGSLDASTPRMPTVPAAPSRPTIRRASDPELRKKALARKLRGSSAPAFRASGPMPAVNLPHADNGALKDRLEVDLKARYQTRLAAAKQQQVQRYLDAADKAEQDKDPVSAANALKIAAQLDPDNEALSKRLEAVQFSATRALSDSYLEQAQYEEREGRLERAALNFEKAARGKGSAALYDRAASCLLAAGLNQKHAGELARQAVELAPDRAEYRVTLARIYASAKMLNSAVKEAERAVRLAPQDETVKTWLKRIIRGEF